MMKNTSRSLSRILIISAAVIALAVLLFVTALIIVDFPLPGQGLLHGRSTILLAAAFGLLTGLACALLVVIFRVGRAAEATVLQRTKRERAAATGGVPAAPGAQAERSAELVSDTADELRTTVGVIQEELEEILDDEAPADKEHMQSLYEETDRLKKIVDSMEQLSRVQAIARPDSWEALQVEPLLKDVIEATKRAVTDRDVTYTLECEAGLAMRVNPECISLIIGNIADNAARSIKGAGRVTVTAGRDEDRVVFSVRDTGSGIRRAHLAHIYERFFRGTGAGVGMGLSIAKELVDACGGTIEVQTAVNQGTTFTIQLPIQ